jgi:predicted house-cleaning noncanonical NTP pyrophosphatase (MazG superfamily)
MDKIFYNKLIRDKIPAVIRARGAECETENIDDERFKEEIMKKATEEASGLSQAKNREELLEELADVHVVLSEIQKLHGITDEEFKTALAENIALKGGFDAHVYLHWSSDDGYRTNEPKGHGA